MSRRTIVTIDEIRLHGFDARDASGIGEALRLELSRTLRETPVGRQARKVSAHIAERVANGVRSKC